MKKLFPILIPILCAVAFALTAWHFLYDEHADVMYFLQQKSFFSDTSEFFDECRQKPMGIFVWAGLYLTQFFYYPQQGIIIIIALWVITFFALKQALHLSTWLSPLLILPMYYFLAKDLSIGYDIYFAPSEGQLFVPTLQLFAGSLLLLIITSVGGLFFHHDKSIMGKLPLTARWITGIVLLCGVAYSGWTYVDGKINRNPYFLSETRAYVAAEEQDWDKVLDIMNNMTVDASREMVILKNIALLNTGRIGNEMYHYDDKGVIPVSENDTAKVTMTATAGPLIYMHHGMTNSAVRWLMETAVAKGFDFGIIKLLTLCSLVNEEYDVADKYIEILSHSMFYKEWADHYRPIIADHSLLRKTPELKNIIELHDHIIQDTSSDNGKIENFLMSYFRNADSNGSKYMQDVCMTYALNTKDIKTFWSQFFVYANMNNGEEMPIHYQEAAFLYGQLEPQTMNTSGMPFDQERIVKRYVAFNEKVKQLMQNGTTQEMLPMALKSEYGDTFWWAYYFNRDGKTY